MRAPRLGRRGGASFAGAPPTVLRVRPTTPAAHRRQNRTVRIVPCPMCHGDVAYGCWPLQEGDGLTTPMWDCAQRHHARTDPQEWDRLRLEMLAAELREFLAEAG